MTHRGGLRSQRCDNITAEVRDEAQAGVAREALRQLALPHYCLPTTDPQTLTVYP